jgi:hypothetical protein
MHQANNEWQISTAELRRFSRVRSAHGGDALPLERVLFDARVQR